MGFDSIKQVADSDYSIPFLATVVDNNDPLFLQRVKISIPGLLSSTPWAFVCRSSPFGSTETASNVSVPTVGSEVIVVFQQSDPKFPMVIGVTSSLRTPTPAELKTNYPNRRGWKDPSGNVFYVDNTAGSETVFFQHKSGTRIRILPDGSCDVESVANVSYRCTDFSVEASGNISIQSGAAISMQSASGTSMNASSVDVSASSVGITAGSTALNSAVSADSMAVSGKLSQAGISVGAEHVHPAYRGPTGTVLG